jgi:hypothetical protein
MKRIRCFISSRPADGLAEQCYGRNSVLLQLGHGGSVSVESFSTTVCPHLVQAYVPFPGFSPVVDISELLATGEWNNRADAARFRT